MSNDKPQEYKTIPAFSEVSDADQGIVTHYIAVMGNVDLGNDVIHPGAFTKTLTERGGRIRVVDQHRTDSIMRVLGKPLEIREVPREALPTEMLRMYPEATGGVLAKTQYLLDTPEGLGAFTRIKNGAISEYSFGYDPLVFDYSKQTINGEETPIRNLRELRMWEYSPVIFGMNPATMTVGVKMVQPFGDLPLGDRGATWDDTAADRRVRAWAGAEEAPNARYARAFMWHDAGDPENFGSYKLGFADVVNDELVAIPRGLFAVAGALMGARGGVDIPDADKARVRRVVEQYYEKMAREWEDEGVVAPWNKAVKSGRVISKANHERIMHAIESIQAGLMALSEMLESAGIQETPEEEYIEDEAQPDEMDGCAPKPRRKEAGPQSAAPTSAREKLLLEIDLLSTL